MGKGKYFILCKFDLVFIFASFERQRMTFDEIKAHLRGKTVGIAGCGGLGSNCAVALARVGVGTLVLADYDVIIISNLNRQYFFLDQVGMLKTEALEINIGRINPDVKVILHNVMLTPENIPAIFKDCDVIIEGFDLADQKQMLIETVLSVFQEKYLVLGLGMAGWGLSNELMVRASDKMYICGDGVSEISSDHPPLAPRVGIVANQQANVALEILLK